MYSVMGLPTADRAAHVLTLSVLFFEIQNAKLVTHANCLSWLVLACMGTAKNCPMKTRFEKQLECRLNGNPTRGLSVITDWPTYLLIVGRFRLAKARVRAESALFQLWHTVQTWTLPDLSGWSLRVAYWIDWQGYRLPCCLFHLAAGCFSANAITSSSPRAFRALFSDKTLCSRTATEWWVATGGTKRQTARNYLWVIGCFNKSRVNKVYFLEKHTVELLLTMGPYQYWFLHNEYQKHWCFISGGAAHKT